MNRAEVLEKFRNINIWKSGDKRAPHKPLLILLALSEYLRGNKHLSFLRFESKLNDLLFEFGSILKPRSYYPFVRLASDHIWTFNQLSIIENFNGADPSPKYLKDHEISGLFIPEIQGHLDRDPSLLVEIAFEILDHHFPSSLHNDILDAIGFPIDGFITTTKRKRDPKFRDKILVAYEYQCAVCGFNVRLGNQPLALEAAHIKWHQAGGPDIEQNGFALCSLHHKLFDLGAFTINDNYQLIVSDRVNGNTGKEEWLMKYHQKAIRKPQSNLYQPKEDYLQWHVREVFKGYGRTY